MRRPLAGISVLFLLFLFLLCETGDRGSPPQSAAAALLEAKTQESGGVTVRGTVKKCDAVPTGLRLSVNHLTIQEDSEADASDSFLQSETTIIFTTENTKIQPGDEVLVSGEFRAYEETANPGEFNEKEYYLAQNAVGRLGRAQILETERGAPSLTRTLWQVRRALADSYGRILPEEQAGVIAAVSLGEKSRMSKEWKDTFQEGGIAHILAISGLHVSLIGMSIYRFLRRLGLGFLPGTLVSGACLFLYLIMSGFSISAVRACLMFGIWLGAQVCGRKYDMPTGIAAAAVMVCGRSAANLYQASFLLSFSAVLALALLVPAIKASCQIRSGAAAAAVSSLAVWMGTLPFSLYFFFQASPWSILVNLAVVPLMSVLMASGLAAAVVGLASVSAGSFLAAPVCYLLACFKWLCELEQKLPLPVWVAGCPARWRVVLYYGVLLAAALWVRRNAAADERAGSAARGRVQRRATADERAGSAARGRVQHRATVNEGALRPPVAPASCAWRARLTWICAGLICLALMGFHPRTNLQIDCLDVGQGDCSLVQLPGGETCLIDGGSSSETDVWEYVIEPAVKYYGVQMLDYLFLSHADTDHVNGITEFLETYEPGFFGRNVHGVSVGHIVLPPCADDDDFAGLRELAAAKGLAVLRMAAGGSVSGGSWKISCLAPDTEGLTGDRNEDSMVLMLACGQFRMLFTGDLEEGAEQRLARTAADLRADVLKAGHHGSAGACSQEFLQRVQARLAVISCGKNNRYGHPAAETLKRLAAAGCEYLVTAQCGAVTVTSDGKNFAVKTGNGG